MTELKDKYRFHKKDAKQRGIAFQLTFGEWLKIWEDSGHLHERGRHKGQYVMARFGDKGPYSIDNVKIITSTENHVEGRLGKRHTLKTRKKISKATKGVPKPPRTLEHRKKNGIAIAKTKNSVSYWLYRA